MRRAISLIVVFLLMSTVCYAQVPRNASTASTEVTKTNLTNLELTGNDVSGSPSYLVLTGATDVTSDAFRPRYYLWVNSSGELYLASGSALSGFSSFPNGDWTGTEFDVKGTKVGGQ